MLLHRGGISRQIAQGKSSGGRSAVNGPEVVALSVPMRSLSVLKGDKRA